MEDDSINLPNFKKDPNQKQRFLYRGNFQLDIVPFGAIMKSNNKIFWPPNEELAMSVLGFTAADESTLKVKIDNETENKIASFIGIFILIIIAWKDRYFCAMVAYGR